MKTFLVCLFMLLIAAVPASSMNSFEAVPPGNWAKVESLAPGADISVKMVFGDKVEGSYEGLDTDAIRIKVGNQDRTYPKKDVAEIRLLDIHDSSLNGTLMGFGIGAAALGIFTGISLHSLGWTSTGESVAITVGAACLGGGIGALVGYAVDRTNKGSELVYRTP